MSKKYMGYADTVTGVKIVQFKTYIHRSKQYTRNMVFGLLGNIYTLHVSQHSVEPV